MPICNTRPTVVWREASPMRARPASQCSAFWWSARYTGSLPTCCLQAGIFTRDAKLLFNAYEELEVGGLIAGDVPSFRIDHMPYGGIKDSGLGREGLRYAIEEMTEPKLLVMNVR